MCAHMKKVLKRPSRLNIHTRQEGEPPGRPIFFIALYRHMAQVMQLYFDRLSPLTLDIQMEIQLYSILQH